MVYNIIKFLIVLTLALNANATYLDSVDVTNGGSAINNTNPLGVRLSDGTSYISTLPVTLTGSTNGLALDSSLITLNGKDFATQTTLALIKAKTDNIDVALSTRTKPSDTQNIIGTVTANVGTSGGLALESGHLASIDSSTSSISTQLSGSISTSRTWTLSASNDSTRANIYDGAGNALTSLDDGNGGRALEVAQGATNFIFSTVNSSTSQLAAGATFSGTIESVTNQQSASVLLTTDQNGVLTFTEYINSSGTRVSRTSTYSIVAGTPFSRSFVINGNYFKVSFTNNGASTTTTFNLNTAYGTIPSATALGNGQVSLDEVNGTAFSLGQKTTSASLPVVLALPENTYSATFNGAVTATTPTDVFTITGVANKKIKIKYIYIDGEQTTSATIRANVIRRSSANTGGSSTTLTSVAYDQTSGASSAVVRAYTTNPTLGTTVGTVSSKLLRINTAGSTPTPVEFFNENTLIGDNTLNSASEVLSVNLGSTTITGDTMTFTIVWTEQ
jgi:hypothetical protein